MNISDTQRSPDAIPGPTSFTRQPDIISISQRGQTVILNSRSGQYHTLNQLGTRVWELVSAGLTRDAVAKSILEEFDLPADVALDQFHRNVDTLLAQLIDGGLVMPSVLGDSREAQNLAVAVTPASRSLPVLEVSGPSALPPLYAQWVDRILGGPIRNEPHATCHDCAMTKPAGVAATAHGRQYNPIVKCCTFVPTLPNFLVGRILEDDTVEGAPGRRSIERRIAMGDAVTPLGLAMPSDYSLVYKQAGDALFGRSEALMCPHYLPHDGGLCGIWRNRNAVCATYYCKFERGAKGARFWADLNRVLLRAEQSLALWVAVELCGGIDLLGGALLTFGGVELPRTIAREYDQKISFDPRTGWGC